MVLQTEGLSREPNAAPGESDAPGCKLHLTHLRAERLVDQI